MTLFKGGERRNGFYGDPTYNPYERPSMPLASLALDGILGGGGTDSGEAVDPLAMLALPTAYRCVSIISTVVASCALEAIDRNDEASPWSTWQGLQTYTPWEITELIIAHMAGWGNFYGRKVMIGSRLVDLQPIYPGNVSVLRINGQKIFRVRTPVPDAPLQGTVAVQDLTEDDVLHIPFLGYDGLQGVSPVGAMAQTFGTSIAADRLAAKFHASGQQLGGIIKVKVPLASQAQADAIKQQWQSNHAGTRNSGRVAVLDAETDFTPITINPNDLQLIQGREWQGQEIARIYGVPLTMLSFNSTGYGDAIETQQVGFVTYTVRSYTDRIEQRLAREFMPRGSRLQFDLSSLMRGAMSERFMAWNTAIAGGWMTRAEARAAENMPEIAGLDTPLEPQATAGTLPMPPMTDPNASPPPAPPVPADDEDSSDNESQDETE